MKAERNRPTKFDSRLIRKPRQQPRLQRTAWGVLNLVFWAFLLYLWTPLLTLLLWLLGIRLAWRQLYEYQQQIDPFLLMAVPAILLCSAAGLILWAEYNRWRFTNRERRSAVAAIDARQIALDLGATYKLAEGLARSKSVVLHMDEHARPVAITCLQRLKRRASADTPPRQTPP